jgi:threonine aldolase
MKEKKWSIKMLVDLRSDTVTKPGPGMRRAMAEAEVGDDVFGEDPTVNKLQEMGAELVGKESALFMASGTMSNQVAIKTHTHHGESVILGEGAHSYLLESGAIVALSGVMPVVVGKGGTYTREDMVSAIIGKSIHNPATSLVMIENTHNRGGGIIFPLKDIEEICTEARARGLKTHLDGARVFNAAVALGINVREITKHFDSVSFCLSKGLGAPVGSLLCGSKEFIAQALRYRKMFGGGMRQAGGLAAAGIYALEHNIERLYDDHQNARKLALALEELPGIELDLNKVQTNIIIFRVKRHDMDALKLMVSLKENRVLCLPVSKDQIRLVTHLDVSSEGIDYAINVFHRILG